MVVVFFIIMFVICFKFKKVWVVEELGVKGFWRLGEEIELFVKLDYEGVMLFKSKKVKEVLLFWEDLGVGGW